MLSESDNKRRVEAPLIPDSRAMDAASENFAVSEYLRELPNVVARGLLYVIITAALSGLVYSLISKIDVVVEGKAVAKPISHMVRILSDRNGFIERIFIAEGQVVDKNSPLFLIRSKEGLTYKTRVEELRGTIPLKEEYLSIKLSAALDKLKQLNENFAKSVKIKRLKVQQNTLRLNSIDSDLVYWKKEQDFRSVDQDRTEKLLEKDVISARERDRVSISVEKARAEVKKLMSEREIVLEENKIIEEEIEKETANYRNEKLLLEKEIKNCELEKRTTLNVMYNELVMTQKMLSLQSNAFSRNDRNVEEEKMIVAENSGTVAEINFRNTGEYIRESDLLCTIIPADSPLYMDITVANKDIGFIEKNMVVRYKFDAFPYIDYGTLSGIVTGISPSAVEDKNGGFVYHVHGTLNEPYYVIKDRTYGIKVGMTGRAELVVKRRSLFALLLEKLETRK
jgi:multidrug efflux pump subunit AcrA (membrane-fusion protein)